MASNPHDYIVILPSARRVSVIACVRGERGVKIAAHASVRGTWGDDVEAAGVALRTLLEEQGLSESPAYSVLPRYEITTRIVELPSTDPDELDSMLKLNASEYVPFSDEETVVGHTLLHRETGGSSRVLAVFAHRDMLERHASVLKAAGVTPEGVFLSTATIASVVHGARAIGMPERYAIANLGAEGIEVLAFGASGLEYVRAVSTSHEWNMDGPDATEAVEEFAVEMRASMAAYRRASHDGQGVDLGYVACETCDPRPICDAAAHELTTPCEPEVFTESLVNGPIDNSVSISLLGAALAVEGRAKYVLRLTPPSLSHAREDAERRTKIRNVALIAVLGVLLVGALYGQAVWQRTSYLSQLEKRIQAVEPAARASIEKQRQLLIIKSQVDEPATPLELLAEIAARSPGGMNITRYEYDEEDGITLQGRAYSESSPARLAQILRELGLDEFPQFKETQSFGWRPVKEFDQTVYEFTIESPFPQEGEEDVERDDE